MSDLETKPFHASFPEDAERYLVYEVPYLRNLEEGYETLWHDVEPETTHCLSLESYLDESQNLEVVCIWKKKKGCDAKLHWQPTEPTDSLSTTGLSLRLRLKPRSQRRLRLVIQPEATDLPGDYAFRIEVRTEDGSLGFYALPTLRLVRPKDTLLRFLPTAHSATTEPSGRNQPSATFFERYLRAFEEVWKDTERRLEVVPTLHDPQQTPKEFLDWLEWALGLPRLSNVPELRRRRLLSEAATLYHWRGTGVALRRWLEILTSGRVEISDAPRTGLTLGMGSRFGEAPPLGSLNPHTFEVTITISGSDVLDEQLLHEVIAMLKPAHTGYALVIVQKAYS